MLTSNVNEKSRHSTWIRTSGRDAAFTTLPPLGSSARIEPLPITQPRFGVPSPSLVTSSRVRPMLDLELSNHFSPGADYVITHNHIYTFLFFFDQFTLSRNEFIKSTQKEHCCSKYKIRSLWLLLLPLLLKFMKLEKYYWCLQNSQFDTFSNHYSRFLYLKLIKQIRTLLAMIFQDSSKIAMERINQFLWLFCIFFCFMWSITQMPATNANKEAKA